MADNIELDAGSGGATVAADDVGGVHYQVVKLDVGADGVAAPVSNSNPVPVSDAGGTLTVDGTVTANLGAVDNGVLDAIQAATEATQAAVEGTLTVGSHAVTNAGTFAVQAAQSGTWNVTVNAAIAAGDNNIGNVDVASSALPTGAATSANQTTIIGHVDGIEALLTTIDADTGGILTAVQTIDNAISGNEMQVDVLTSALPSGAATSALQAAATSHYRNIDANAEAEIKGSAGTMYWLHVMNLTAAKAYVHLYDATAANVNPGTTVPNYTFPVGTQGDTNGAGFAMNFGGKGQAFANGITLVVTTTIDGAAGDPGSNGVFVNAGYS